jgi:hypothetical protein
VLDSQASQAWRGRNRIIRVSYSLTEEKHDVRISGDISGIATTNPSVLGALSGIPESGSQRTVDLMGKEKYVSFLTELLGEIKRAANP